MQKMPKHQEMEYIETTNTKIMSENIQKEYEFFIINCTNTPKSIRNYKDFSRINQSIAKLEGLDTFDIYSIESADKISNLASRLEKDPEFQAYNEKGKRQYTNTLNTYIRFLKAREFFKESDATEAYRKETLRTNILPLQQIFYGAPGTGKSHTIKEHTEGQDVIRTTFHPDTDYSTFVGAYKPTMKLLPICNELGEPVKIGGSTMHKEQISYEFVPQAFLQAYVAAWQKMGKAENCGNAGAEYLVIEEINRGNCAQIFGDLFQLLDRGDNGFSEYPINADADMKSCLQKAFKALDLGGVSDAINRMYNGEDIARQVKAGDILLLPSNLYIWATMNTSDQSLFPIDSAFKRRWDWQYVPISDAGKQWVIRVNGNDYNWWRFLEEINKRIYDATYSEDKKLGYFFCKANSGVIDADVFVSKVVFYLWNDVFKDMEFESDAFKDGEGGKLSFDKFYTVEAGKTKVVSDKVELFLRNLGLEPIETIEEDGNAEAATFLESGKYKFNGEPLPLKDIVKEVVLKFIENHPELTTAQSIKDNFVAACSGFGTTVVKTESEYNLLADQMSPERYWQKIVLTNEEKLYVYTQWSAKNANDNFIKFIKVIEDNHWGDIIPAE